MNTKNNRQSVVFGIAASVLFAGGLALADDTVVVSTSAPEKTSGLYNALEIGAGFGYSQGVGNVGNGVRSLTDSGSAGVSGELDLGWRIDPHWLVGTYGTVAWLSRGDAPGNAFNNWTATAGLQGNYHFLPGENLDPWIGLGAGWRGYFVNMARGQGFSARPRRRSLASGLRRSRFDWSHHFPVRRRHCERVPDAATRTGELVPGHLESERQRVLQRGSDGPIRLARQRLFSQGFSSVIRVVRDGPRLFARAGAFSSHQQGDST